MIVKFGKYFRLKLVLVMVTSWLILSGFVIFLAFDGLAAFIGLDCYVENVGTFRVTAPFELRIDSLLVNNGDSVKVGMPLFQYSEKINLFDSLQAEAELDKSIFESNECEINKMIGRVLGEKCKAMNIAVQLNEIQLSRHKRRSFAAQANGVIRYSITRENYIGRVMSKGDNLFLIQSGESEIFAKIGFYDLGYLDFSEEPIIFYKTSRGFGYRKSKLKWNKKNFIVNDSGASIRIVLPQPNDIKYGAAGKIFLPTKQNYSFSIF